MPKYSTANDDRGLVFDAAGNELKYVYECDTETGWVKECVMEDGVAKIVGGEFVYRQRRYPAPLRFIRIVEGD
jgi:hypothetical protein